MQTTAKWAVLVPLFLIPFLALYVANGMFFPFITGKHFLFRVLVEIATAGWIVLAFADRRYRPKWSLIALSFLGLVAWLAVADLLAVNPHKAFWSNFERMEGWVTIVHVFLLFLVAGSALSVGKLWRKWWLTFIAAAALVCGYGLLQLSGAAPIHQSGTRLDATLGNSEYFAGFLLFAIAITLWQAFATKPGTWLRSGLYALTALELLMLFETGTRGTMVALVGASLFGGLLFLLTAGGKARTRAAVFVGSMLVLVTGFYMMRDTAFVQQDPTLSRLAAISISELGTRITIWHMALEGAQERPFIGWGQEGFNYVFNAHYVPSLYGQESWFDRAHNIYLDWLIAGGLPALLLFLALFLSALYAVYRAPELAPYERILILSAFVGYGIQGLVVFDNLFTYVPLALLLAYAHTLRSKDVPLLDRLPEAGEGKLTVVAPVALIVVLITAYAVNVPTYAANRELIQGLMPQYSPEARLAHFKNALAREPFATQEIREQLITVAQSVVSSNASNEQKTAFVTYAAEQMEAEIARAPKDARLYMLYASFLRSIGQFDPARAVAAKAREHSPQKQGIILEQGFIEWQDGDKKRARAYFDEAHALAPDAEEITIYAAAGRIITGEVAAGKELLNEQFGTTTLNHLILAIAYQDARAYADLAAVLELRYRESDDATTGYQIAMAYAQAGRMAEARAQARAVLAAHPETAAQGSALLLQLGAR